MNKKLYYTDYNEVALMKRWHGVKIDLTEFVNGESYDGICVGDLEDDVKYYVAKDSLRLFEPMEGDLILHPHAPDTTYSIKIKDDIKWALAHNGKIIQRNNRPFLMPQTEQINNGE